MKLLALVLIACGLHADMFPVRAPRWYSSTTAPSGGCTADADTDKIYVHKQAATTTDYRCYKTGASTFAWGVLAGGGAGEANTGANVGTTGIGPYDGKSGMELQFRKINPASSKVTVVLNGQMIDLDVPSSFADLATGSNSTATTTWASGSSLLANGATRTAPSKSGTSLPGTCTVADTYIKTDATSTLQLYLCTATNTWTAQGGSGSGATMAAQLGDLAVVRTSDTVLTIGTNCSTTDPCLVRFNGVVYPIVASTVLTLTTGNGLAYIEVATGGTLSVVSNLTIASCTGNSCSSTAGTAFTVGAIPVATWGTTANIWDATGLDKRAFLSRHNVLAGTGLTVSSEGAAGTTLAINSAVTPQIIGSGAKALATGAIASTACATDTVTATGVASTDVVTVTFNADVTGVTGYAPVTAGGLAIYVWPTTNTVNIKTCNPTAGSITPGAVTLNWRVIR